MFCAVTGQPLRCDVIVDEIVKVEIETTTKELFLDDSPEEFVLRAVNDKGMLYASSFSMSSCTVLEDIFNQQQ